MLKIGLTGGIGSGKSTVSTLFKKLNIDVIDADVIAKELTEPNQPATKKIIAHFGQKILSSCGEIDRKKLKLLIFSDKDEKKWLENYLHPLILETMKERCNYVQSPYCILVIPLLKETPSSRTLVNRILVIDTLPSLQIKRIQTRDHLNKDIIQKILHMQASSQERLSMADDVITNNDGIEELQAQVEQLHKKYLKISLDLLHNSTS